MGQPVVHFEIGSADTAQAAAFYAGLFGWTVDANNPMNYGIVDTHAADAAESGIGGGIAEGAPRVMVYVQVDDPQAALDSAVALGGSVVEPVSDNPMVTMAIFADPDGNHIGLVKPH